MKRGEKEQNCLERAKKVIFYNNGTLRRDFDGKSYLDVSDEKFNKSYCSYFEFCNNAFGLSKEDKIEVANILRKAKANEQANNFPDFVFDNGFIEHFQFTSSKETKKGSRQTIQEKDFERKAEKCETEFRERCNNTPDFENIRSVSTSMDIPEHSEEYLHESFKRNFGNHIKSLENYNGNKKVGIFMVENFEFAVNMYEDIYNGLKENVSYGDLRQAQDFSCYRLSRDKVLLNYLYEYRDKIKYVIYVYNDQERRNGATGMEAFYAYNVPKIEVIKLENIPYILQLLPWKFIVCPLNGGRVRTMQCISIKVNGSKNE